MVTSEKQHFVVITGPVGVGKSTVAQNLASLMRRQHRMRVAVIDLDVVYCMLRQREGFDEPEVWADARHSSAILASSLLRSGFGGVILEGEFSSKAQLAPFGDRSLKLPPPGLFTLNASFQTVRQRVAGDPSRGASKDPVFLKRLHYAFCSSLPYLESAGIVLSADDASSSDLARTIAGKIPS